jgi:single-stranded DNA-binding protein
VAWNSLAEVAAEYLAKGRRVRVEGRVRGHMWAGRYDVDVIAGGVEFLPLRAA